MKTEHDKFTVDFLSPARGRPPKLHPRTAAQRTADWRRRKNNVNIENLIIQTNELIDSPIITVTSDAKSCIWCGVDQSNCCGICNVGQLGHI